jgi:hypothetical protein
MTFDQKTAKNTGEMSHLANMPKLCASGAENSKKTTKNPEV